MILEDGDDDEVDARTKNARRNDDDAPVFAGRRCPLLLRFVMVVAWGVLGVFVEWNGRGRKLAIPCAIIIG